MTLSHVSRIQQKDICLLTSYIPDSISMYFYLRLDKTKAQKFYRDMDDKTELSLTDYGEILESGIGEVPTEESIAKMQNEYGFETTYDA